MEIKKEINEWLDNCSESTEIIQEFDNAIWVQIKHPWEEESDK